MKTIPAIYIPSPIPVSLSHIIDLNHQDNVLKAQEVAAKIQDIRERNLAYINICCVCANKGDLDTAKEMICNIKNDIKTRLSLLQFVMQKASDQVKKSSGTRSTSSDNATRLVIQLARFAHRTIH